MKNIEVEPFADDVPLNGPGRPKVETADELLRLLATIRHRWGNTVITFSGKWGSNALWARDSLMDEADDWKLKAGMAVTQAADYLAAIMAITPWLSASLTERPDSCKEYRDACETLFALEQEALSAANRDKSEPAVTTNR